ncbi:30S ribosomal protein S15 [bacterium 336/3]|jgi:small subunit ribosomal protein S15|nr:30S ribosomal protein S15 [bacterium 336/3]
MHLSSQDKKEIFAKYSFSKNATDTGSPESQIALFTDRINYLTQHLKSNKKDHSSRLGLLKLVGKRKSLLGYLQKTNLERYRQVLNDLNLRK